jgi:flagellar hook assembly protein FlgD
VDAAVIRSILNPTSLDPASPNPFNPQTTLKYSPQDAGKVNLAVYNLRGELVKQLVHEQKSPGANSVVWDGNGRDGSAVASGMYPARFVAGAT